ncbi:MAG: hypothetical protein AAFY37_12315 [Pseudomonadota bacterium]
MHWLSISWFVLTLVTAAGHIVRLTGLIEAGDAGAAAGMAISFVPQLLGMVAIALTYAVLTKIIRDVVVVILGSIHLAFAAIGTVALLVALSQQSLLFQGGDLADTTLMTQAFGVSGFAGVLGSLFFIAALIVGFTMSRAPTAEDTF